MGFLGVKLKEAAVPCRHPRRGGRWGARYPHLDPIDLMSHRTLRQALGRSRERLIDGFHLE